MRRRILEQLFPWIGALVAPLLYFCFWGFLGIAPKADGIAKLTSGVLSLSGILVGFLATTNALMFALPDRPTLKRAKQLKAFSGLVDYLFFDLSVWFAAATTSLILVFSEDRINLHPLRLAIGLWIYIPALGLFGTWRTMSIYKYFLDILAAQEAASSKPVAISQESTGTPTGGTTS